MIVPVFVSLLCCLVLVSGQATVNRDVSGFNGIAVDGPFSISIEIGNKEGVQLQGNQKFIDNIDTVVENGTLKIRFKDWNLLFTGILQIKVSAKTIINLISAGPAQITSSTTISAPTVRVVASGSSQIIANFEGNFALLSISQSASATVSVKVKNVNAVVDNSAVLNLSGSTDNINTVVTGSGNFNGKDLNADTVSVTVNGSGRAQVHGNKEIKAVASDDGTITTSGTDNVVKDTSDGGVVNSS